MTTLAPDFLVATMHLSSFKHGQMIRCQGALLTLALKGICHAAMLPGELLEGSRHISGAATGALVAQELLCEVGRIPSPIKSAKGRRLALLGIPDGRRATVLAWLERNGMHYQAQQQELLFAS